MFSIKWSFLIPSLNRKAVTDTYSNGANLDKVLSLAVPGVRPYFYIWALAVKVNKNKVKIEFVDLIHNIGWYCQTCLLADDSSKL